MTHPRPLPALLLSAALSLLPALGHAANCAAEPNAIWNYLGSIDKYGIGLSLKFDGATVKGDYFYKTQRKNIALRGTVQAGKNKEYNTPIKKIVLEELDKNGQPSARFELEAADDCNYMEGVWRKAGAAKTLSVALSMEATSAGELAHRYRNAGAENDEVVNQGAYRFWLAVKEGKKAEVADLMHYPVEANIKGRRTSLRDRAELLASYDAIFTKAYRQAILESIPHNMFSKNKDIMLGYGQAWFDGQGKVITLNN